MDSHLGGTAIRPPDPGERVESVVNSLIEDIEAQCILLEANLAKTDQKSAVGLQLICDESVYIWREIHLLRQDPSRLLRVWNHVVEYREVLLDIHIAVDRSTSLSTRDIDNFCDILRNILIDIRTSDESGGKARNRTSPRHSGTNSSIVQGARNINMTGGRYVINNNYNTGPELVHLFASTEVGS